MLAGMCLFILIGIAYYQFWDWTSHWILVRGIFEVEYNERGEQQSLVSKRHHLVWVRRVSKCNERTDNVFLFIDHSRPRLLVSRWNLLTREVESAWIGGASAVAGMARVLRCRLAKRGLAGIYLNAAENIQAYGLGQVVCGTAVTFTAQAAAIIWSIRESEMKEMKIGNWRKHSGLEIAPHYFYSFGEM